MAEIAPQLLVAEFHAAPIKAVLAITGGGSRAIGQLLEVPGGSRTVLEAVVPYSAAAIEDLLRAKPEQFCSARTARAMAVAAFERAMKLTRTQELRDNQPAADPSQPAISASELVGIGCTASLASNRPKRGPHRIHVAWQRLSATATHSIELVKGRRNREEEEQLAARMILNAAADAAGISDRSAIGNSADEPISTERTDAPPAWRNLLLGTIAAVRHEGGSIETADSAPPEAQQGRRAIFPGAFNPLHDGHRHMAELAAEALRMPVEFEISIENVDKPPLDFTEMNGRLSQFTAGQTVWFTRAGTFDRKAALFPNSTFIVGADTIRRIADPRYYGNEPLAAAAAIESLERHGARFLVFSRLVGQRFESLACLELPAALRLLCEEVPAEHFRQDISSTLLRGSQQA
jgi:hypothetical protein